MTNIEKTTTQDPEEVPELDFLVGDVPQVVSETTLERLGALAETAQNLTDEINKDDEELSEKSKELANILRVLIPNIMDTLEMKEYTMMSGVKISVINKVQASIAEKNKPAAFAWLNKYNFGGMIKTTIISEFGKEEVENAEKTLKMLKEQGVSAEIVQSVHALTLKSFVKERLAAVEEVRNKVTEEEKQATIDGQEFAAFDDETSDVEKIPPIPQDIFGVFTFKEAKIVVPKK
jgi:hypothetical protein